MNADEHAAQMSVDALRAASDGEYHAFCLHGEPVFFFEHSHALAPGHIYSAKGVDEFKISRFCEYHFDEAFKEEE